MPTAAVPEAPLEIVLPPPRPKLGRSGGDTGGGDEGETSLGDGSRVSKLDQRIAAFGTVDELNAAIG